MNDEASATVNPAASATAPAAAPDAAPGPASGPAPAPTPAAAPFALRMTVEGLLYAVMIAAAALTRFWDLGSRALHHDESLHAYFSWLLATGSGYIHDPLMHGPFLFHANALVYFLLGASDASSRFWPALCGTLLVAMPYLLRGPRHLGRWGALAASFLLLISPALLYQGRYIRHDTFTVAASLLLFIAIVRYVERPGRGWLCTGSVALGVLITNHEIVFGIVAFFVFVLAGALLWKELRAALPVVLAAGLAAVVLAAKLPDWTGRPLPAIPWERPSREDQFHFYEQLLTNPLTIVLLLLAATAVAAAALALTRRRDPERIGEGWVASLLGNAPPGSVAGAVNAAWADRRGLTIALAIFGAMFVFFFTTMLTNPYGLASGTVATDGTLLYWLGQHDYRRGEQPWFYYLLLWPQYEPIAAILGTAAAVAIGWRALLRALGKRPEGPQFLCAMLLAVWYAGVALSLSWAGEKMPWLIIHITLPATLLAAMAIGRAVERWLPDPARPAAAWGAPEWLLAAGLLLAAAAWFLLAAPMTYGEFVPSSEPGGWSRQVVPADAARWGLLAVPPLAALGVTIVAGALRGPRRALRAAAAAGLALLTLLQVHFGWRLSYLEGDVPKDMLVYTQTAPDVHRMVGELAALSQETTGGLALDIRYDSGVSWPLQWYLRDFSNKTMTNGSTGNASVVIVASDSIAMLNDTIANYTPQEYVLRWWFPEDPIYRNFAIAPEIGAGRSAWKSEDQPHGPGDVLRSIGSSLATLGTPEGQQRVYRLLMYRDLPARIDSYRFTLYIRNDLVPLFNDIRY
ncbi:MAG: flippase activity-associated protein Agl23 [Chloroflexota bacterium]